MDLYKSRGKCFEKDLSFQTSQKTVMVHQNIMSIRSLGEFDPIAHMWVWITQPFFFSGGRDWKCGPVPGREAESVAVTEEL